MATLALAAAGAAVGSALLPTGITVLGATLTGAAIGSQAGALAGSFIDQALFAPSGRTRAFQGPRLTDLHVTGSTEGAPIPRIYGRSRLGGQVIWATDFEEETVTTTSQGGGGGKGRSGGSAASATVQQIEYRYYANLAVALAEGEIAGIGRVWADGLELDLSGVTWRLHAGSETQQPDSLIVAREGADGAPAYRGIAYIVFEHLPLAQFGNRIPQLSFEVSRTVDQVSSEIRGVVLIPGSGEWVYAPAPVTRLGAGGVRVYENVHTRQGGTDWQVSIDQLEQALPNARSVSLVVSWFGTDLRAAACQIRPGVELADKSNHPAEWSAGGVSRTHAHVVSQHQGRPAFGGTPADASVIAAIADLKARGISVVVNPFILMDVPAGNTLANPWDGSPTQPVYPWRGRITLDPAAGVPGSPDKSAAAAAQIATFVGTAAADDFAIIDGAVVYNGPAEWSYRRHILHNAWLARAAGGVDAFVLGSEMRSLTHARDAASSYPFVAALVQLAADVKTVLGTGTKITYAADWSEYFGHQPADGSGDVHFHLDPLWASPHIDAIGIDVYWPLADWRAGPDHADAVAGAPSTYDLDYLKSNIVAGEGYDWYYANDSDRALQLRTPITDGVGKPWVFRYKDLTSWWSNSHHDRPGGIEAATATAWVARSKPIWLLETGCPAIDKGANQPNVFVDPKSSETALPYFSDGRRDDLIQRRYLQALVEAFDPAHPGAIPGLNPTSNIYGGPMVDPARIHVYAWDARPYPAFPNDLESWGDGGSWRTGHWLNGRVAGSSLADVVAGMLDDYGFSDYAAAGLEGVVEGYVIDHVMSAREALQPLELAYFFDAVESGGRIELRHRAAPTTALALTDGDMVDRPRATSPMVLVRGQESELPTVAKVAYANTVGDYRQAIAEARRLAAGTGRVAQAALAIALDPELAEQVAETWLFETWAARERATFALPPSHLAVEPGDVVTVQIGERHRRYRVIGISDRGEREIEALGTDPSVYVGTSGSVRAGAVHTPPAAGQPLADFLDLPLLRGDEPDEAGYIATSQTPWPGGIAIYHAPDTSGFRLGAVAAAPATTGTLIDPLPAGPISRLDRGSTVHVALDRGELASVTPLSQLAGANLAAIHKPDGEWEVLQFATATLEAPSTYRLTGLLRGQAGTEAAMASPAPAGARFVLIDEALARIDLATGEVGLPLNWRYGPAARDLGHESFTGRVHAFRGIGRRPLSPVHLEAARAGGDVTLSWIRRTRLGGDSWEIPEVPLGEDAEAYDVDILGPASEVVRTISTTTTSAVYTAAEQIADFGAPQAAIAVRIYQRNNQWGRGSPAQATL